MNQKKSIKIDKERRKFLLTLLGLAATFGVGYKVGAITGGGITTTTITNTKTKKETFTTTKYTTVTKTKTITQTYIPEIKANLEIPYQELESILRSYKIALNSIAKELKEIAQKENRVYTVTVTKTVPSQTRTVTKTYTITKTITTTKPAYIVETTPSSIDCCKGYGAIVTGYLDKDIIWAYVNVGRDDLKIRDKSSVAIRPSDMDFILALYSLTAQLAGKPDSKNICADTNGEYCPIVVLDDIKRQTYNNYPLLEGKVVSGYIFKLDKNTGDLFVYDTTKSQFIRASSYLSNLVAEGRFKELLYFGSALEQRAGRKICEAYC